MLSHGSGRAGGPRARGRPRRPGSARITAALLARAQWDTTRTATIAAARAERVVRSATADTDHPAAARADEDAGLAPVAAAGTGPAAAKGEALHAVLELIDLDDPGGLDALVASVCADAGLDDDAKEILALARECLASAALARARAGDGIWREVPYVLAADDGYRTGGSTSSSARATRCR